jgi:hypothetical protein
MVINVQSGSRRGQLKKKKAVNPKRYSMTLLSDFRPNASELLGRAVARLSLGVSPRFGKRPVRVQRGFLQCIVMPLEVLHNRLDSVTEGVDRSQYRGRSCYQSRRRLMNV